MQLFGFVDQAQPTVTRPLGLSGLGNKAKSLTVQEVKSSLYQ